MNEWMTEWLKKQRKEGRDQQMQEWTSKCVIGYMDCWLVEKWVTVGPDWLDDWWVDELIVVFATTDTTEHWTTCELNVNDCLSAGGSSDWWQKASWAEAASKWHLFRLVSVPSSCPCLSIQLVDWLL